MRDRRHPQGEGREGDQLRGGEEAKVGGRQRGRRIARRSDGSRGRTAPRRTREEPDVDRDLAAVRARRSGRGTPAACAQVSGTRRPRNSRSAIRGWYIVSSSAPAIANSSEPKPASPMPTARPLAPGHPLAGPRAWMIAAATKAVTPRSLRRRSPAHGSLLRSAGRSRGPRSPAPRPRRAGRSARWAAGGRRRRSSSHHDAGEGRPAPSPEEGNPMDRRPSPKVVPTADGRLSRRSFEAIR